MHSRNNKKQRVLMLPYFPQNPYQVLLKKELENLGYNVRGVQMTWNIANVARKENADIIHFHWLHPWTAKTKWIFFIIKYQVWRFRLQSLKRSGVRLIWTIHNLKDHENRSPLMDRVFSNGMARLSNRIICHSQQAIEEATEYFRVDQKKFSEIAHGNYVDWYRNDIGRDQARLRLGISPSAQVVIAFGEIRPYKNTLELIKAFSKIESKLAILLIVGRCRDKIHQDAIERAAAKDTRIRCFFGFVQDDEVQFYLNAADLFALPYKNILTSGAALLAMSFGLPLLAPRLRCFEETPGDEGAILYNPNDGGLETSLRDSFADSNRLDSMKNHNKRLVEHYNWKDIASSTVDLYRSQPIC